ncbi:MAG: YeeE/YedE family protein [Hyphomicrobiaceae bacterium]|nr:MAG: YeeE/YedE family protein [Hyphomicrobiaceae bacterium]
MVLPVGGFICGFLAGFAAQYGRLCTVGAIEDALVARDYRRASAWAVSAAVAILITQALVFADVLDLSATHYVLARMDLLGLIVGGLLFGLGAALVGTCAFGLLVRIGTGDLRALVSAVLLGLAAFAATGGILSPLRQSLADFGAVDTTGVGGTTLTAIASTQLGNAAAVLCALLVPAVLLAFGIGNQRLHKKPRLIAASCLMGVAIAGGWLATGVIADPFTVQRPESLTFVAPLGRLILNIMGETLSSTSFGVATLFGVAMGSLAVALARGELRWEAFDDQREMRRHLLGALLMGFGGVLARGCTIGQGLTGTSTLSIAAPIAVAAMVVGARFGLTHLIEGRPLFARWR